MKLVPDFNKLRKQKLLIATPSYDGHHNEFTGSLLRTMHLFIQHGLAFNFTPWPGESLIPRARNRLAHIFLYGGDHTHILFKDADQGWEAEDVMNMLALDLPICGALYAKKSINWERVVAAVKAGVPTEKLPLICCDYVCNFLSPEVKVNEPMEVRHLGNGSMMIKREVFEKMMEAFPDNRYDATTDEKHLLIPPATYFFDFFGVGPDQDVKLGDGRAYLSEDWYFCANASKLGYKLWLLPWMKTTHYGQFAYRSDLQAMLDAKVMM